MAWISTTAGDTDTAIERIDAAVKLFEETGDTLGLAWAYGLLGWVRLQQGHLVEADALAQRVLGQWDDRADEWGHAMMELLLATTRLWLGRTDEAVELAGEARARFAAINDGTGELRAVATLSRALLAAGEIRHARDLLAEATAMADSAADGDARTLGRMITAGIAVQLGEAGRYMDLGELLEQGGPAPIGPDQQVPRAIALLQLGRSDQARTLLQQTYEGADEPGLRQAAGSTLAFAHAVVGAADDAVAVADEVEAEAEGTYLDHMGALFSRGFAHVQRGETEEARADLAAAVALSDRTEDRLSQAFSRLAQSRGLEALGDPEAADARTDAEERLASIGIVDSGWDDLFRRAATGGDAARV